MRTYSIILPVRNGGDYVKECINSILNQRYRFFNLIVLDNNSSDGTREWVAGLDDERVIIHESIASLSIEENWTRVIKAAKNEFITMIGHDDLLDDNYLMEMDKIIGEFPDASLYQTHFRYIDGCGLKTRDCKPMLLRETGPAFLQSILTNSVDIMGTGFMVRSKDYDAIGGIPNYPNLLFADFELWLLLTAKNYKITSPNQCFSYRIHAGTTSTSTDKKMQEAFERFIYFLSKKKSQQDFNSVIVKNSLAFISNYCKGLSHRLLRSRLAARDNVTVRQFTFKCKAYADLLVPGNDFNPINIPSVRMAIILDSNPVLRLLFRTFKKIYSKPVLN